MACGGDHASILYPKKLPTGGSGPGGPTIQNGRMTRRRNAYFNRSLYRVSELIQRPAQITYREFCILVWAVYAFYMLFFSARDAWRLLAVANVHVVCGPGQSFLGCGQDMVRRMLYMSYLYLAEVVPWAILCVVVVFAGEEVMRQQGVIHRK